MNKELACRRGPAAEVCVAIARVRACVCARRLCVCLEGTAGSQGATREPSAEGHEEPPGEAGRACGSPQGEGVTAEHRVGRTLHTCQRQAALT